MKPKVITLALNTADANAIASGTPASGASFTLDGALVTSGVATMDAPRHVYISASGNESSNTITITGTDRFGNAISEAVTGPNATSNNSTKNFNTVTAVAVDASAAGNVLIGSAASAESKWYILDYHRDPFNIGIGVDLSSGLTTTFTVQHTLSTNFFNYTGTTIDETTDHAAFNHAELAGDTANESGAITSPVTAIRLMVSAHGSGSVNMRFIQAGIRGA